jgi:hypothetical protein
VAPQLSQGERVASWHTDLFVTHHHAMIAIQTVRKCFATLNLQMDLVDR